jgi:hypothetical protein
MEAQSVVGTRLADIRHPIRSVIVLVAPPPRHIPDQQVLSYPVLQRVEARRFRSWRNLCAWGTLFARVTGMLTMAASNFFAVAMKRRPRTRCAGTPHTRFLP